MKRIILPLISLLMLGACKEELYSGLTQKDANEMTAILADANINSERVRAKDGAMTINVEKNDFAKATQMLSKQGYPREKFSNLAEVFNDKSLVKTPLAERARLVYALEQELSETISQLSQVVSARVHVVLPDTDPLKQNAPLSSASVVIKYHEGTDISLLGPQIRRLVAASIEGLSYDRVAVTLFPASGNLGANESGAVQEDASSNQVANQVSANTNQISAKK